MDRKVLTWRSLPSTRPLLLLVSSPLHTLHALSTPSVSPWFPQFDLCCLHLPRTNTDIPGAGHHFPHRNSVCKLCWPETCYKPGRLMLFFFFLSDIVKILLISILHYSYFYSTTSQRKILYFLPDWTVFSDEDLTQMQTFLQVNHLTTPQIFFVTLWR